MDECILLRLLLLLLLWLGVHRSVWHWDILGIWQFFGTIWYNQEKKLPLAIGGLLNIYNAGGVITFLAFWFLPELIGIGAIICLIAGILLLISAFLSEVTNLHTINNESYYTSPASNIVPGYNRAENNSNYFMQHNEYSSSHPLIRYCRFCGKKLH